MTHTESERLYEQAIKFFAKYGNVSHDVGRLLAVPPTERQLNEVAVYALNNIADNGYTPQDVQGAYDVIRKHHAWTQLEFGVTDDDDNTSLGADDFPEERMEQ